MADLKCKWCGEPVEIDYWLERYNGICRNEKCEKHGLRVGNSPTVEGLKEQWKIITAA